MNDDNDYGKLNEVINKNSANICNIIKKSGITEIAEKNKSALNSMSDIISKSGLLDIVKIATESLNRIWNNYDFSYINQIGEIFKNIDFSDIDENFKKACEIMLINGFYPYGDMEISLWKIVNIKSKKKLEAEVSKNIEYHVFHNKKNFLKSFSDYKYIIYEIYRLYEKRKYRLCILSQINLISMIYNSKFDNKDLSECDERILKDKGIISTTNREFCIFIPFLIDYNEKNKNRKLKMYKNNLIGNYRKSPEEYKKYPYNRNAIIHGYSKKFGTKINCLRWFSVLLNMLNIIELYEEDISGGKNE